MVQKRWWPVAGGVLLYLSYLLSIRLYVSKQEAVYNGFELMNQCGRILAVTAHPDDLEIFMGGTLKLLSRRKREIHVIDVTDGEKGVRRKNLAQTRISEQIQACKVLGVENVHFLHLPDLHLQQTKSLRPVLHDKIKAIKPEVVFAFDYLYPLRAIIHPDHIAAGRAVADIVHSDLQDTVLMLYGTRRPDTVIDISESLPNKIESIRMHRSQLRFGTAPYGILTSLLARYNSKQTVGRYVEIFRKD